ncbi:MAG: DUF3592 domain-containing protein [Kangiellaceae bacterium]
MEFLVDTVMILGSFCLGLYLFIPGFQGVIYGRASERWPVVKGLIIKSEIVSDGEGGASVKIRYRYWINNKSYLGKTIGFCKYGSKTNSANSVGDASYVSNQFPERKEVNVYYHPAKYHIAVLEPGFNRASILVFAFGLMFIGAGIFFLTNVIR